MYKNNHINTQAFQDVPKDFDLYKIKKKKKKKKKLTLSKGN